MKKIFFIPAFILFLSFSCSPPRDNPEVYGLIQPINLEEGKSKTIVLSDLFYSTDYKIEILQNENFEVNIDTSQNELTIKANNNFSGIDLIGFNLGENEYQVPVILKKRNKYLFKFKSEGSPQSVNLFGQFNSWNRQDLPMRDRDGDGTYEIYVSLDPGSYEYKIFVDGAEVIDPENPVKVPNGLGDFNSVRVIEKKTSDKQYLHLIDFNQNSDSSIFIFYYESNNQDKIAPENVIALADNQAIKPRLLILNDNYIKVWFDGEYLRNKKVLRVAINKNGKATNFQNIFLKDSKPLNEKYFTKWNDAVIYSIMIDRFNDGDKINSIPIEHPDLSLKANYQG
ncbi:MAG: hypothetical protein R3321_09075, partial [Nitrososphaeraceae archaeon]|nr:hypothetical protein [Nitrososphaeraceae archaeon]